MFRAYRYRRLWVAAPVAALLLIAATVAAAVVLRTPGNVAGSDAGFDPSALSAPPRAGAATGTAGSGPGFRWPLYGLTPERTKYLPLDRPLRPPFVERWRFSGRVLLEFTPVLCGDRLLLLKDNGALVALGRRAGTLLWARRLGSLAAASPACDGRSVYAVVLERGRGVGAGRVAALDARSGRIRWQRSLPSRSESSPLLIGDRLYFGTEDGTVMALSARTGATRWTYRAGGAVKGGLAFSGDRLVFGDYSGAVTALRRRDGSRLWRTTTSGRSFGLGAGSFYGTPAIAYGRVFIGNTDGFVYAFGLARGQLAWRHRTGGYVYSGPAVSPVLGGTIYAGSYDNHLYAFDARSGRVRWRHHAGGRIVGSPVVIGDLVFYANLGRRSVTAVGSATGRTVWSVGHGGFNSVISDGRAIYLNGYSTLFAYSERGRSLRTAARPAARRPDPRRTARGKRHTAGASRGAPGSRRRPARP